MLPNSVQRMLGMCATLYTELAQLQHCGEMTRDKDSSFTVSLLALCGAAASTMNCAPSRGRSMAMTLLSLALVGIFRKWVRHSRKDGGPVIK